MTTSTHELAIGELKKQAKRLRKEAGPASPDPKHQQLLQEAARRAGFRDWQHARRVLTGAASPGEDFGTFWLGRPTGGFLNEWHARYDEARASWAKQPGTFLLPYKTQFVIVGAELMRHAGIDDGLLGQGSDLLAEPERWDVLSSQRLRRLFAT